VIDDKPIGAALERRSRQKDPDEESELWRESVRAYEEKRRQMARLEWHHHHTAQAERLRRTPYTMPTERWSASGLKARYAKTGSGIVPRLSTSTAPRNEG
jgi:hypothetical protein